MKFDIENMKEATHNMFETSIRLFVASISTTLTLFFILGAMCSMLLLIFLLPEKAVIILEPFSMLFDVLWSFIKATFFVSIFFFLLYALVILLDSNIKIKNRRTVRDNIYNLKLRAEIKKELIEESKKKRSKK